MQLYLFLFGGTLLMLLVMAFANKIVHLPFRKLMICGVLLLPVGVFGTRLMRLIESGTWNGYSFYGAVFLVPVIMTILSKVLSMDTGKLLDTCAPAGCVMLALMKVNCIITGCCYGRMIRFGRSGMAVRFPSQITELIAGLILLVVILKIIYSEKQQGIVYAWFLFLYGSSRFLLNLLRETSPFLLGLSAGCFWSVLAVLIGGGFLILKNSRSGRNAAA